MVLCRSAVPAVSSPLACSGRWLTPFDPAFTEVDTFHLDEYEAVKVPMMFRAGNFASTFDEDLRCHVLKLPYWGNATMLVVLMEKTGEHLALEDYLTADLVDTWLRNMKTRYSEPLALHERSLSILAGAQPPCRPPRGAGGPLSAEGGGPCFPLCPSISQH